MSEDPRKMFYGADAPIFRNAHKLRNEMTRAEKKLWEALSGKKLNGLKFRRQHPIGSFIADFYCHAVKLVIELDGSVHDSEEAKARDAERDKMMSDWGIQVVRFRNNEIYENLDAVLKRIKEASALAGPKGESPHPRFP